MSKNIVTLALFVAVLLSANGVVWGQVPFPCWQPAANYFGLVDLTKPDPLNYPNGITSTTSMSMGVIIGWRFDTNPNLGPFPPSHITKYGVHPNNRIFHYQGCVQDNTTPYSFTFYAYPNTFPNTGDRAAAANRLWDNVYSLWGYTKVNPNSSIDPSKNCHGYSTGLNTWASIQPILNDDYEHTWRRDHLTPGTAVQGLIFARIASINVFVHINGSLAFGIPSPGVNSHSSRIDAVHLLAGTHDLTIKVTEKNCESALYEKTFTMEAACPLDNNGNPDHLLPHPFPCTMVNAPLPWAPSGFYRKKP